MNFIKLTVLVIGLMAPIVASATIKLQCPKDIDLGCNPAEIPKPDPASLKVEDDCRGELKVIHVEDDLVSIGCKIVVTRIYRATNECGDREECTQTICYVVDENPPTFDNCNREIDLGCNPRIGGFTTPMTASDFCGEVKVEYLGEETSNDGCHFESIRKYKATDECGNTSVCKQVVRWTQDTKKPTFKCPDDVDLGCNPDFSEGLPSPPKDYLDQLKIEEKCDYKVEYIDDSDIVVKGCHYSWGRTWIVTDECGNQASCRQTFSWTSDVIAPVFEDCNKEIDLGCNPDPGESLTIDNPHDVKATDNCSEVEIKVIDEEKRIDGCTHYLVKTYQATDACGNQSTCFIRWKWTIVEKDIDFQCPPNIDLGCNPVLDDELPGIIAKSEQFFKDQSHCQVKIRHEFYSDVVVWKCIAEWGIIWTIEDLCGHVDTCVQIISWTIDAIPPTFIDCDIEVDLGCIDAQGTIVDSDPYSVQAEDLCGEVDIEVLQEERRQEGCQHTLERLFRATDACGNSSTCIKSWTWRVSEEIEIECMPDVDLGCNPDLSQGLPTPGLEDYPQLINDNQACWNVIDYIDDSDIVVYGCHYSRGRTWIVSDDCGNADTCRQGFYWTVDNQSPVIVCPPLTFLGCVVGNPDLTLDLGDFEISDNCEVDTVYALPGHLLINPETCTHDFTREVVVVDNCGNMSSCVQAFEYKVVDELPPNPSIPRPADITVCGPIPPAPNYDTILSCGVGYPVLIASSIQNGPCDDGDGCIVTRTWRMRGCGGLQIIEDQTITINCQFAPGLANPGAPHVRHEFPWQVSLSPNPGTNFIRIEWSQVDDPSAMIQIMDLSGKVYQQQSVTGFHQQSQVDIQVPDLPAGIYLVKLASKNHSNTQKWVKL